MLWARNGLHEKPGRIGVRLMSVVRRTCESDAGLTQLWVRTRICPLEAGATRARRQTRKDQGVAAIAGLAKARLLFSLKPRPTAFPPATIK